MEKEKDNVFDEYINNATNPIKSESMLLDEDNAYSDYTSENHLTVLDKDNKKELYSDDVYSDYIISSQEELEEQATKRNIR